MSGGCHPRPSARARLAAAAVVCSACAGSSIADEVSLPDLVLIHFSDTHSAYDRYPRLLAAVRRTVGEAEAPVAILVGGDVFERGNALARRSGGALDWALLAALADLAPVWLDLGNHDADVGEGGFERVASSARALGIRVTGSLRDGRTCEPLAVPFSPLASGVAVVGVSPDREDLYPPEVRASVSQVEPVAWVVEGVAAAFAAGSSAVVVLSHAGVAADLRILAAVPPGTLVLGGHDHVVRTGARGRSVYVQGGAFAERLVVVAVRLAGGRATFDVTTVEIGSDEVPDAALAAALEELLAHALSPGDREALGVVDRRRSLPEAALWATEAVREATGSDVAFLNHTAFGSGLEAGPLERWRFDRFLRFDNAVVVADVDGSTLARCLAFARRRREGALEDAAGDFVYATPVRGERSRSYRVATSDWVASHAERYLGTEIRFRPVAGARTKSIVRGQLAGAAR